MDKDTDEIKDDAVKSKTQVKKEALEAQKLGETLIALSVPQLKCMGLPEELLSALLQAKKITSHIAGRRQRQYIGSLMRDIDLLPIRNALDTIESGPSYNAELNRQFERLKDQLLSGDSETIEQFLASNPELDRQQLRQLIRNCAKNNKKSLKTLKQLIQKHYRQ